MPFRIRTPGMEMTLVKSLHNFLKTILVDDVRSIEGFLSVQIPGHYYSGYSVIGASGPSNDDGVKIWVYSPTPSFSLNTTFNNKTEDLDNVQFEAPRNCFLSHIAQRDIFIEFIRTRYVLVHTSKKVRDTWDLVPKFIVDFKIKSTWIIGV